MTTDSLSATFAALADPTRRAILARLATGQLSVTELAAPFDVSLPAISKHLRVLEHAGLITRGREAQWRPCRIEAGPIKDVAAWAERYRAVWEQRLDRLDSYLQQLAGKENTAPLGTARGALSVSRRAKPPAQRGRVGSKPPVQSKEKVHGRQRRRQ
jgi:DNA-binding transcriptional ArsR family regulator